MTSSTTRASVKSLCIIGGTSTAWMSAAALAHSLKNTAIEIHLVDPPQNANEPLADSTLPSIFEFNQTLGLTEANLFKNTQTTFKLATTYRNWRGKNNSFSIPFSEHGFMLKALKFHQLISHLKKLGHPYRFNDYSLAAMTASHGKFSHPQHASNSILSTLSYAYHLDKNKYTDQIKQLVEQSNVRIHRTEDTIHPEFNSQTNLIDCIRFGDKKICSDLFIDCSGDNRVLADINNTEINLDTKIPNDRSIRLTHNTQQQLPSDTTVTMSKHGWYSATPLSDKTAIQFYYNKTILTDNQAEDELVDQLSKAGFSPGSLSSVSTHCEAPRYLKDSWINNCVFIGRSNRVLDKIHVNDLHLDQAAILRLIDLLPSTTDFAHNRNEFNRLTSEENKHITEFDSLSYLIAKGMATTYREHIESLDLTDDAHRLVALFKECGKLPLRENETLPEDHMIAFFLGNEVWPRTADTLCHTINTDWLTNELEKIKMVIHNAALSLPPHRDYLTAYKQQLD